MAPDTTSAGAFNRLRLALGKPTAETPYVIPGLLGIPGVVCKYPVAASDGTLDADSLSFQPSLRKLWGKLSSAGLFTDYQVRLAVQIVDAGFPIYPASAASITSLDPTGHAATIPPGADPVKWDAIVAGFKDAMGAYYKKNFQAAKDASAALEADVTLWEVVYKVTETIAEAPKAVLGAGLSWLFDWRVIGAVVVIGGAYLIYSQRGKLANAAGSAIAAKIG